MALVAFGERLGLRAFWVGVVVPAATFVWLCTQLGQVTGGTPPTEQFEWVPDLGLTVDLRLDGLAATMSLIVCGVGVHILVYSARYFAADARDLGRLAGLLVLFAGSMLLLVQADQVIVLYTGWELTTITSFLLIGIGLGIAACEQARRVRYATCAQLVNELVEAADERRLARLVARYGRLDLLLIDEVGYVQLDVRGAELLFQVLTDDE